MALKIKLKRFTDSSGDPSTSDLEVGEVGINPVQKKIFVNNSGTIVALGSADFSAVDQDIIPDGNGTRNLGSSSKRFKELFRSTIRWICFFKRSKKTKVRILWGFKRCKQNNK